MTKDIKDTLVGIESAMNIITLGVELQAQTQRFRNLLTRSDLENVMANSIAALKVLGVQLKEELTDDDHGE